MAVVPVQCPQCRGISVVKYGQPYNVLLDILGQPHIDGPVRTTLSPAAKWRQIA